MSVKPTPIIVREGAAKNARIQTNSGYQECEIKSSQIQKLPLILELYETITSIKLILDEPLPFWPQFLPHQQRLFQNIKTLIITSHRKTKMRENTVPDNIWLIFPNLTQLNCYDTYMPADNLQYLNLSIFHLTYKKFAKKTMKPKIQEIISAIEQMTTLKSIFIDSPYPAKITDSLFANNPGLTNVWINDIVLDNIPSISLCSELKELKLVINILNNPYILELKNMNNVIIEFPTNDLSGITLPDDLFARPIFTTFKDYLYIKLENYIINTTGSNYLNLVSIYKHVLTAACKDLYFRKEK
jgi:hypothetical protein